MSENVRQSCVSRPCTKASPRHAGRCDDCDRLRGRRRCERAACRLARCYRRLVHFEHDDANSKPARMLSPAPVSDKCPAHARAVAAIVLRVIAMTRLRRRVIPAMCRPSNAGVRRAAPNRQSRWHDRICRVRVVGACNQPLLSRRAVSMEHGGSGLSIQRGLSFRDRPVFERCSRTPQLSLTQYWCGG
jgi:hypothetical protein